MITNMKRNRKKKTKTKTKPSKWLSQRIYIMKIKMNNKSLVDVEGEMDGSSSSSSSAG
jgi:hypothetical protein